MLKVFISVLNDTIEVSEGGRFELPSREYTASELKKIAREVNRITRKSLIEDNLEVD